MKTWDTGALRRWAPAQDLEAASLAKTLPVSRQKAPRATGMRC